MENIRIGGLRVYYHVTRDFSKCSKGAAKSKISEACDSQYLNITGAGDGSRTHDLLITNHKMINYKMSNQ